MQTVNFIKTEDILKKINALFKIEKQKLTALFPDADIEHVGGTSVPGSLSKGDLDINIRVAPENFEKTVETLKTLYKINQLNNWSKGFASFKNEARELSIQVTAISSPEDYFVAQRDYLKSHPKKVVELNTLKEKFEDKSMDEYRKEKEEFFEKLNTHFITPDPRT
ncbi:MAG: hypothetical protein A3F94_01775 [Candidatus Spechtbacteria bacterium RIFCSPLOWO2_12_FULL_38_22]|uniref:GrpB family protein n=1 Tax=Candidatus Spechtbacteria bacterium RIFCSPLOWO2_12_FULL_38_22 TaxID=1802165 RepID=A0A1G2HJ10_9BACT|nr:MAG: hypothetical protein A2728_00310 [Candidatus Spechtbacteria bacterium RIFCSPHIGHO2_01_FULL_38_11]OGZ59275.1 MAG: hypothetical protein A3A00_01600 [Candidatus Spechtbacteria bacterium RIFCSPLOWO2_01_FULL_38_20]OGZ60283.1 MAG: hypothetical protein A3E58_01230 [Candidatus Spechtbacteria bacterium RIFCSPHIGHO2_12_FULL_38_30]OGZ62492.1 MAG: hypothetical protein A3F94_01775 [Candidatus Spechtbacteria bacterium RIFCSPLOWO2_12_FULL_38_22]